MRPAREEKMKEKHKTPQHKTLLCLCSCRVVCCSSTAAAASATHHQDTHGCSFDARSGEPRREEKSHEKKEDKKDDREERGIRKGGKERSWCVCCFQGLKGQGQQRIKATKASPQRPKPMDEIDADDGVHRSTRRI